MTCTTHHHACACREARFEAMFKEQEAHVESLEAALLGLIDSNAPEHVQAALNALTFWRLIRNKNYGL